MSQEFLQQLEAARKKTEMAAIGALLEPFRPWLERKARRLLAAKPLPQVTPEDLTQETALKVVLNFVQFAGQSEGEFRSWLATILQNTLENLRRYFQGKKRDSERESPDAWPNGGSLIEQIQISDPSPSSQARRREWDGLLWRAIDQLPDRHREVVLLRDRDDLSFVEIGQQLGCSEEAARKLFKRAVEMLRAQLAQHQTGDG